MPNMYATSPRSFIEKLLFKYPFMLSRNSISFPINNMSSTYNIRNARAPTHFLVNTGFSKSLYKTICFDHTTKTFIPTPRGLHQSINGSLELAHFVSTLWIDKTFWLHHIQFFFQKSIQECSFVIHLPNFIIIKCGNC